MQRFRAVSAESIGSMDNHIRIEQLVHNTWMTYATKSVFTGLDSARARTRFLWRCTVLLLLPFHTLIIFLLAIVGSFRLALANADRVIFVLATSILSFYQVPTKVFYIYIGVLAVTGFLQFLGTDSLLRIILLYTVDLITIRKSNLLLRKFSDLHFSNPFTRTWTQTQTIFFPVGHIVPNDSNMKVFKFPVSPDLNFFKEGEIVGNCTITIRTVQESSVLEESSTVRSLRVEAPWGDNTVTFSMEDENLGRFISYLDHVVEKKCEQVICTKSRCHAACRALTIAETIEYFNRGLSLVKLELRDNDFYFIS